MAAHKNFILTKKKMKKQNSPWFSLFFLFSQFYVQIIDFIACEIPFSILLLSNKKKSTHKCNDCIVKRGRRRQKKRKTIYISILQNNYKWLAGLCNTNIRVHFEVTQKKNYMKEKKKDLEFFIFITIFGGAK